MAIYSPLRSRRLAAQQAEATQRLITFKLGTETFALPLDRVQKVTTLEQIHADPQRTGVTLTTYQGQEVVLVDVEHQIFGRAPQVLDLSEWNSQPHLTSPFNAAPIRYLLILKSTPADEMLPTPAKIAKEPRLIGIPIDLPPSIQALPLSAFGPLLNQYPDLHCVSAVSSAVPVNALLRRRTFRLDGASLVEQKLNTDRSDISVDTDSIPTDRSLIFLLDTTSIVGC